MGREDGFAVADVSSGHFDDDKVRKLWRSIGDVSRMCEAMTIHMAVVLASWRSGKRVAVADALPLWLPASPVLVDELVAAGLLDRSGRIPARSWTDWYGTAAARRDARREAGRLGGLAKGKRSDSKATATLYPSGRQAGPSVPTDSVRPSRAGATAERPRGARGESAPTSLGDALAGTPLGDAIQARRGGSRD